MKSMLFTLLFVAALLSAFVTNAQNCNGRYHDFIFGSADVSTVVYSTAHNTVLTMDIYQPHGDSVAQRPVIVLAHGGGFTGGTTTDDTAVVALCKNFARRGYVTASINYRIDTSVINISLDSTYFLTVLARAISDAKAAIRFFRKDASTVNAYRINPNLIFGGGDDAGATIFMHVAYIDSIYECPTDLASALENNGGIDGNSGNAGYASSIVAVINLAGGLNSPALIGPGNIPSVNFQGDQDNVTPYFCNNFEGGAVSVRLCGLGSLTPYYQSAGITCQNVIYPGQGHSPWLTNIAQLTQVDTVVANFLLPYACGGSIPLSVSVGADQSFCAGSSVELNTTVTGGIAPYNYHWSASNGSLQCSSCANPVATLSQNTVYSVTVTDAAQSSMSASVSYQLNGTTNTMSAVSHSTYINCTTGSDTTTVTISGGTPPYTVIWDNSGASTSGASPQTYNYQQAGGKIIMVTDANLCASTITDSVISISPVVNLVQSLWGSCSNGYAGQLTAEAGSGIPPYTYYWPYNAGNTDTLNNAPPGTYAVIVTDANNCTTQGAYTINAQGYNNFYVYASVTEPNCGQSGNITALPTGGTPPYNYLWSDSETTASIQVNVSGQFEVAVTDSTGCLTRGYAVVESACVSNITGYTFIDSAGNCNRTGSQPVASMMIIATSATSGNAYYGYSDNNGYYDVKVYEAGQFTLNLIQYGYYQVCGNYTICGNNSTVNITTLGDSSNNNNIGFTPGQAFNLGILPGWTSANPGFTKQYHIYYYNTSFTNYYGPAVITFTYDSNLIYTGTDMQPTPVNNTAMHTLTWSPGSVLSAFSNNLWPEVDAFFQVPAGLSLNYPLQSRFSITPTTSDCDSSDNAYSYSEIVTGSHDPNEKTVSPAGPVTEADSVLTYTIHFQNTGTDATHFVVIKDTLSANLDPATVRNIASSDKYSLFTITGNGILTWTFSPLQIVDSATDPIGSKRFIMFSVKKKAGLATGSTISNTASIYFDYNNAVVTNTVTDTEALPVYIFDIPDHSDIHVSAFPNPFNDVTHIVVDGVNEKFGFELYDITGRLQQNIPSVNNNRFNISRGQLANGVYLYRIVVTGKQAAYGKLVVE